MNSLSEPIIRVENLAKKYLIRHQERGARYEALRDVLARGLRRTAGLLRGRKAFIEASTEEFWALRDVNFDIQEGDVVGIIGRNGAGKSTLLKILSRITEPTAGKVTLHGRIASLLEVGTGFHHELTGRENIYLNGSILGMKRREIARKFDEIVSFAEVEKFLDTPVKRYSSGMYVRLAFAVAAHLEPEILIVDEVLAVGDAGFQRKCLNKMESIGQRGRTVLFVSHSLPAIARLCQKCILLEQGRVTKAGIAHQVTSHYLRSGSRTIAARSWPELKTAPGNDIVRLRATRVKDLDGEVHETVDIRRPVAIEIEFDVLREGPILVPTIQVTNEDGVLAFVACNVASLYHSTPRPVGRHVSVAIIPGNFLSEGGYLISVAVSTFRPVQVHFFERDAIGFEVLDLQEGDSARGDYAGPMLGVIRPMLQWRDEYTPVSNTPQEVLQSP